MLFVWHKYTYYGRFCFSKPDVLLLFKLLMWRLGVKLNVFFYSFSFKTHQPGFTAHWNIQSYVLVTRLYLGSPAKRWNCFSDSSWICTWFQKTPGGDGIRCVHPSQLTVTPVGACEQTCEWVISIVTVNLNDLTFPPPFFSISKQCWLVL